MNKQMNVYHFRLIDKVGEGTYMYGDCLKLYSETTWIGRRSSDDSVIQLVFSLRTIIYLINKPTTGYIIKNYAMYNITKALKVESNIMKCRVARDQPIRAAFTVYIPWQSWYLLLYTHTHAHAHSPCTTFVHCCT